MQNEIEGIKARNARVEADKAWETSITRRIIIAIATYICIAVFLVLINAPNPYFNSLVPTAAYILSTLSMPFLKNFWIKNFYKK